jgi:UDP-N-acetylglucosamine pyrophosphorylase
MKPTVNFIERYKNSLSKIPSSTREIVNRHGGLSENQLLDLILKPKDYGVNFPEVVSDSAIESNFDIEECYKIGSKSIQEGKVAYCIMAGDISVNDDKPNALLRIPGLGMSLLTLKLFQAAGTGPIWIVVNPKNRFEIEDHVRQQIGIEQERINFIEQHQSYRLTPDNQISFINGEIDVYPCGHGDLYPILTHSKVLEKFRDKGTKYVSITTVENIMGYLDPIAIGRHIMTKANVSCEVVERTETEAGGLLCDFKGQLQIIESFKIFGTDISELKWLNTNNFIFNAGLNISPLGREWNRIQRNLGTRIVIQHERFLEEITDAYDTKYFAVNKEDKFFPIKTISDLEIAEKLLSVNKALF